jgi:hypothetical protein
MIEILVRDRGCVGTEAFDFGLCSAHSRGQEIVTRLQYGSATPLSSQPGTNLVWFTKSVLAKHCLT